MEFTTNIEDIDFDGSKIVSVERKDSGLSIEIQDCALLKSHPAFAELPNKIGVLLIEFASVSEEKADLFVGDGVSEENTCMPPLDVIEVFQRENGKFQFSGYLDNKPWSVWAFKAEKYVVSW